MFSCDLEREIFFSIFLIYIISAFITCLNNIYKNCNKIVIILTCSRVNKAIEKYFSFIFLVYNILCVTENRIISAKEDEVMQTMQLHMIINSTKLFTNSWSRAGTVYYVV